MAAVEPRPSAMQATAESAMMGERWRPRNAPRISLRPKGLTGSSSLSKRRDRHGRPGRSLLDSRGRRKVGRCYPLPPPRQELREHLHLVRAQHPGVGRHIGAAVGDPGDDLVVGHPSAHHREVGTPLPPIPLDGVAVLAALAVEEPVSYTHLTLPTSDL